MRSTTAAACASVTAMSSWELVKLTEDAGVSPKKTLTPVWNRFPLIVTAVPPRVVPSAGLTEMIRGGVTPTGGFVGEFAGVLVGVIVGVFVCAIDPVGVGVGVLVGVFVVDPTLMLIAPLTTRRPP